VTVSYVDEVVKIVSEVTGLVNVTNETSLVGSLAVCDSMQLVEICLTLEDLSSEHDFTFEWSSDSARSPARSFFRTCETLALEFEQQMRKQQ
jgi:acyl carrier protein